MKKVVYPVKSWRWFGAAGHFIAADSCRFHLVTMVGPWWISTIGDYHPSYPASREEPTTIGCNRLYETMVFKAATCDCGACEGFRMASGSELDFLPANTPAEARDAHMTLCEKFSRKRGPKTVPARGAR